MNHEEQVGKNFAWGAASQLVIRVLGLAFFVYMAHILQEKGMGQYSFISSFVVFWFIISDFGAGSYLYREWSKGNVALEKIEKDFNLVLTTKLLIASLIFIPFVVVNYLVNQDIFFALILFYVSVFFSLLINQADYYFNSTNNFKFGAIRQFIEKTLIIVLSLLFFIFYPTVESVFAAMLISQFFSLYYYFSGRLPFALKVIFDWTRTKELIIKGLPFVFVTIFISLYSRIDIVMLKYFQSFEVVGWYGTAYKFFDVANIFPAILFLPALFPVMSRILNTETREKYHEFFNKSLRVLFSFSLILSLFFIVYAPVIITSLFPTSFWPSILATRILILALVISSLSLLFYNLLIIQNKEKISLKIIIFSCVVNIVLNLILIPRYSLYGAAWATVFAEMVNLLLLQHYADWGKDYKMISKMGGVIFLNILILVALKYYGLMNNLLLGSAVIIFMMLFLWVLGLVNKTDLQIFYLPFKNKLKLTFYK